MVKNTIQLRMRIVRLDTLSIGQNHIEVLTEAFALLIRPYVSTNCLSMADLCCR